MTRLPPWRTLIAPRRDILDGRLAASDFAADLESLLHGRAPSDEALPLPFFARTVITDGLAALLANALRRLSGQGGQPVVHLQTGYGGGKTHALLALHHLAGGTIGTGHFADGAIIRRHAPDAPHRILARRAAISGTGFDAATPRTHPDAVTRTLWGEIAYQLGGADACELVARADDLGIAPGAETWLALFERCGPCLIVLDELVAFGRNIFAARAGDLPAGTFASLLTGLQALSEAVSRSTHAHLVVTLPPASASPDDGAGTAVHAALVDVLGRVDRVWSPVSPEESGLIARRRLFDDAALPAHAATLDAYHAMLAAHPHAFPPDACTPDYLERMAAAFPLHPALTAGLYAAWAPLDRFQRTRGVLRTLALVIATLWAHHDPAPLIMAGGLPLYDAGVRAELVGKLPLSGRWDDVLLRQIDGADAAAFILDRADRQVGRGFTHRRLARALFFGTAPLTDLSRPRGLTRRDLMLATAHPTDPHAHLNRALDRLTKQLVHLKRDGEHFWLSLNTHQ